MSNKEMEKEIKRYLGILSEDFQHRLNLVIDAQLDIKRDVAGLKKDVAELKTKTDVIYSELIAHRDNTEMHVQKAKTRKRA
jgi:SMC interacting uncharacterized protein involved in chromosome segregation